VMGAVVAPAVTMTGMVAAVTAREIAAGERADVARDRIAALRKRADVRARRGPERGACHAAAHRSAATMTAATAAFGVERGRGQNERAGAEHGERQASELAHGFFHGGTPCPCPGAGCGRKTATHFLTLLLRRNFWPDSVRRRAARQG